MTKKMDKFKIIINTVKMIIPAIALSSLLIVMISCVNRPVSEVSSFADKTIDPGARQTSSIPALAKQAPEPAKQYSKPGAPLANFTTANFIGSSHCSMCHENLEDSEGNDVSITNHWRGTMMANAAKDPFWQAKVKSEAQRNPSLTKEIEKKCVPCHMPMAWIQAGSGMEKFGPAGTAGVFEQLLDKNSPLHEAAMDGVSCSFCHQIQQTGLNTAKSYNGQFIIDTSTLAPERPIFGPYIEVYQETMITTLGFTPVYGEHTSSSGLCATCHTLYTPFVDAAGVVRGEFAEQTVYLEWLQSAYGKGGDKNNQKFLTCQNCHMPQAAPGNMLIANPAHKNVKPKDRFSKHNFVGGNVLMLNILHDHIAPLKLTASTENVQATKNRTLKQLQDDTAKLSIPKVQKGLSGMTTVIKVENMVGHKFPTGFPSRRTWIHFTIVNGIGDMIFESGKPLPDGNVAGDNSDDQNGYEPHYDLITKPDEVQIYEAVMRNTDGEVTYTLMRAAAYLKDNRLLPYGFNKQAASPDIRVAGQAERDENFIGGSDEVTYATALGTHSGPFTIRAELLYTPISYAFMSDLGGDDNLAAVSRFKRHYDRADNTPVTVAIAQKTIR